MPDRAVTRILLFGKLPAHGDFVSRGLASEARDALDAWLSGQVEQGRAMLGAEFEARYDAAPPWRFALPEAEGVTAGALTPSVDAAGRRFPIYLALAGLVPAQADSAAAACEELLYDALAGGWDADRLAEAAGAIMPDEGTATDTPGWWTPADDEQDEPIRLTGARPDGLFAALLRRREEAA